MTQYFVDGTGAYLGGFDGAEPPEGALEVPSAPDDARQVWDGSQWGPVVLAPADFPSLSPRQIRLALNDIGITSADVATKLAGNEAGTIEWNYATYFKRTHPLIASLTPAFALTEAQVDSLWLYAAEIK
ncbi:hypothetical protein [Mesorhizobium sp. LNJC405B00]|uniref:hypothetical protein n=1 Tax=Mesorhizobium sp. LNJC405B00 TaxID=1287281 RepID=UPI000ABCA617|nr:hypothetical protein [Mesorhizobium sp. LNJC405B00]